MRIRLPMALSAAATVLTITACGGPSDTTRVRDLVNGYITDFIRHDGKAMCAKLTPAAQGRIQSEAGILRGRDCGRTLTTVSHMLTSNQAAALRHYHAGKVVIDGREAGAVIIPSPPGARPTRIVKVDDRWLIDGSVAISQSASK